MSINIAHILNEAAYECIPDVNIAHFKSQTKNTHLIAYLKEGPINSSRFTAMYNINGCADNFVKVFDVCS